MLGRQSNLGSELGECFQTARQITNGDPGSWQNAWMKTAQNVEAKAQMSLQKEHRVSAREGFLRACTYYRATIISMSPNNPLFKPSLEKMQLCFRQAAELLSPPVERVSVPYQSKSLPGYFAQVDRSQQMRRTLIMIGGGETFAEDLYFYIVPAGLRRGYNILMIDLPGQGDNPYSGLFWDLNTEVQLKAIVDYALSRPEIDVEHLAAYGISGGGYFLGRAATYESRVKAYILNPPLFDFARIFERRWAGDSHEMSRNYEAQSNWRKGLDPDAPPITAKTPDEMEVLKQAALSLVWKPEDLTAPTLCMGGLGEAPAWIEQTRECYQRQPHAQKKLVLIPPEDGAESHCQMENLTLMSQVVFDWLDEVFAPR